MCGITGLILSDGVIQKHNLSNMTSSLNHRGPDSNGIWINENQNFGIGHTRLSILDLSRAGSQPMHSKNNRYIISFNGEIYNHLDIRLDLKKEYPNLEFSGSSDTETILACIEKWGLSKSLKKMKGMFAIALWDKKKEELKLARDRFGEKPMYYGWIKNAFYFGSELKPIKNNPYFNLEIDRNALTQFIKYSYVPQPLTIYKNIKKLKPGTILKVNAKKNILFEEYWSLSNLTKSTSKINSNLNENNTILNLEQKIQESVESQKLSDVPIGAFLSGGIDSSLIVSMMQLNSNTSINSFTIGFDQKLYNEARFASKVAKHLKTNHTELYVSENEVRNIIPMIPNIYDEPFADSSQLPTYLVSELARSKVKVALSGDGGDELFGGYNRYFQAPKWYNIPKPVKFIGSEVLNFLSPNQLQILYNILKPILPKSLHSSNPINHLTKIMDIFKCNSEWEVYDSLVSLCHNSSDIVINNPDLFKSKDNFPINISHLNYEEKMMCLDISTYLTDDILCKVDRAAMSVSLETRAPFLDYDLVEFAWNLPLNFKIRNGEGKWILKKILNKYIPNKLINRPKMGFGIPLETWLRGPLREWAELLLNKKNITDDGFFNYDIVKTLWDDHISEKKNNQYVLWNILVFQSWKSKWL